MPAPMQAIAHQAISALTSNVPGALASTSPQGVLGALASGALTNGAVPSANDIGDVARSITGLADAARDAFGHVASGNFADAVDAAAAFDGVLGSQFAQGREVASRVADAYASGHGVYANGGSDPVGDAMEQLAVATTRLLGER